MDRYSHKNLIYLILIVISVLLGTIGFNISSSARQGSYYYSPFSGLPLRNQPYTRPALAVVENSSRARPQRGLDKATIVYEVPVEGGITRFLALFWEEVPEQIGPIRSVRSYFLDLINEYDPLLLHAGASPDGFSQLQEHNFINLDQIYNSHYYRRSEERKAPHNLYTSSDYIEYLYALPPVTYEERFSFSEVKILNSNVEQAEVINIKYNNNYNVIYRYQDQENKYYRCLFDKKNPHYMEEQKIIKPRNIIIQFVKTKIKDDVGRLDVDFSDRGRALFFNSGVVDKGYWEKNEGESWPRYYDEEGSELELMPGKTWIQIVSDYTEVEW